MGDVDTEKTPVPDPVCIKPGCKNIVESGEEYCGACLDDMTDDKGIVRYPRHG